MVRVLNHFVSAAGRKQKGCVFVERKSLICVCTAAALTEVAVWLCVRLGGCVGLCSSVCVLCFGLLLFVFVCFCVCVCVCLSVFVCVCMRVCVYCVFVHSY